MSCVSSSGTANLRKHLTSCKQYTIGQDNQQKTLIHDDIVVDDLKLAKVSKHVFREASNEMLVLGELPLSFIKSFAFKHFCSQVNLYKPHSRKTATKDIIKMYVKRKAYMKKIIGVNKQRVSLTTDIWVSPKTDVSYMVITAHFIDASWRLRKLIIGFKHILDHKAVSISSKLLECLEEWGIEKVFTITVDNVSANTSALNKFKKIFKSRGNDAFVLGGEFMHMRCSAHILHLIVQDGLQEINHSVIAIRNGIEYVRSSYKRLKSFQLRVESGKMTRGNLPLDVKTRWNSTYLMLSKALKFRLSFDKMKDEDRFFNDYFKEEFDGNKRIGPPTSDDWDNVEKMVEFLKSFYHSTLVVSTSNTMNSSYCYNEIFTIEKKLISLRNSLDESLRTKAIAMKIKFDKYWDGLQNINKILIIASVFDPRKKMHFATTCFKEIYGKGSVKCSELQDLVLDGMRRLFEEYKKVRTLSQVNSLGTSSQNKQNHSNLSGEFDFLDDNDNDEYETIDFMYNKIVNEDESNELEIYLKKKIENPKNNLVGTSCDVLSWWKDNSKKFPVLSELARDVLAMQVSNVASESAFSMSGRIVDSNRSTLTHYMIEVLMCIEQWMKCDIHVTEKVVRIPQMLDDIEHQYKFEKEKNMFEEELNLRNRAMSSCSFDLSQKETKTINSSSIQDSNDNFANKEAKETDDNIVDGCKIKQILETNAKLLRPKRMRKMHSSVWDHYTRTIGDNEKCKCQYCGRILSCFLLSGTSNLHKHLRSCKQYKIMQDNQQKTLSHDDIVGGDHKLAKMSEDDVFRKTSNEMLVLGELPLSFTESFAFKTFCSRVHLYKPYSRSTTTKDIIDMYVTRKADMKKKICANKQRVSLTTNIWVSSTTSASYMVITAHFVDENWRLKTIIIGFKHILDHKAISISSKLIECLEEWGIEKVFTITVDNASENTFALNKFKKIFKYRGNDALVLGGEFMHMRCSTHILNLIVRDGLQEINHSVTAIRSGVEYVRSSYTRLKSFELRVESGKVHRESLSLDVKTMWNSTYIMLSRALKFKLAFDKLKDEYKLFNDYFKEEFDGKKKIGPPIADDWDKVEKMVKFLKIFYHSSLVVSIYATENSSYCYDEICTIEKKLVSLSNNHSTTAIAMRYKFDKYWDGLQKINKLLIIASVFDPRKKMNFATTCFKEFYSKDNVKYSELRDLVLDAMHRLFEEYKRVLNKVGTSSQVESLGTSSQNKHNHFNLSDEFDFLDDDDDEYETMDCVYNEIVNEDTSNELEIYLNEKLENPKNSFLGTTYDVLSWWRVNSKKFPVLSEIARDVLAMQVSTVASEYAFSMSGRIMNPYRSNLTHYMIEVLMCTKQWIKCDVQITEKEMASIPQILNEIEYQNKLE